MPGLKTSAVCVIQSVPLENPWKPTMVSRNVPRSLELALLVLLGSKSYVQIGIDWHVFTLSLLSISIQCHFFSFFCSPACQTSIAFHLCEMKEKWHLAYWFGCGDTVGRDWSPVEYCHFCSESFLHVINGRSGKFCLHWHCFTIRSSRHSSGANRLDKVKHVQKIDYVF